MYPPPEIIDEDPVSQTQSPSGLEQTRRSKNPSDLIGFKSINKLIHTLEKRNSTILLLESCIRRGLVPKTVRKHFDYMKSTDPYLNRVFADGVQIAYKRYRNIREILCRARLFPTPQHDARPKRVQVGFTKCGKCTTCNYAQNVKSFKCYATGEEIRLQQSIKCVDKNIIYVISCQHCRKQYVGKTSNTFRSRMDAHRSAIRVSSSSTETTVAAHFRQPGHKLHHFLSFPIEIVTGDSFTIGVRERYWINRLDVISKGLNKNRTFV